MRAKFLSFFFLFFSFVAHSQSTPVHTSVEALIESYRGLVTHLPESMRAEYVAGLDKEMDLHYKKGWVPATHFARLAALDTPEARAVLKKYVLIDLGLKPFSPVRLEVSLAAVLSAEHADYFTSDLVDPLFGALEHDKLFVAPIVAKVAEKSEELRAKAILALEKHREFELPEGEVDIARGQMHVWGALSDLGEVSFVEPLLKRINEPNLQPDWNKMLLLQSVHFVANWVCVDKPKPLVLEACRKQIGPAIAKASIREELGYDAQETIEGILYSRYDYFTEPQEKNRLKK